MARVQCSKCNGTGKMKCPQCSGIGYYDDDPEFVCSKCLKYSPPGTLPCDKCNGTGYVETSSPSAPASSASSARSASTFQPARQTGGSSSSKGNIVLAILLGLVSAVMLLLTSIMLINNLSALVTLALWAVVFAAGFILFFIAWRNRKTVMIIILAALSIGGMLYAFSRPSSPKPAAAQTANANGNAAATVNANVNFRAEPSTGDNIIRQLQQGDTVTLTGETNGGWTQIQHNGDTGWISTEFLSK